MSIVSTWEQVFVQHESFIHNYHTFKQFALAPKSSTIGTRLWHVFPGGFRWLFDVNMSGVGGFFHMSRCRKVLQLLEAPVDQDRTGDGGRICDSDSYDTNGDRTHRDGYCSFCIEAFNHHGGAWSFMLVIQRPNSSNPPWNSIAPENLNGWKVKCFLWGRPFFPGSASVKLTYLAGKWTLWRCLSYLKNGDISSSYISLWKGSDSIVVFEVFWLQFGVTV